MATEAIYAFKQSLALCPESPEAQLPARATLHGTWPSRGSAGHACRHCRNSTRSTTRSRTAIQQITSIKQSRSDVPRLEEARSNNPRDFNLVVQLGQAYVKAGQADRLAPLLHGYLAQTNLSPDEMLQVAQLYMNLGKPDDAAEALQVSTRRFPQDGRSFYSIAMIRASQNNVTEALPMLAKAIQVMPEFRAKAATEQVFGSLRSDPRFQQLINSQ